MTGASPPSGRRGGAAVQPYSLRGLRGPAPCSYFLCKQKVTKKLPKPRVLDSYVFLFFAPEARYGVSKSVLTASPDFCFCFGVS